LWRVQRRELFKESLKERAGSIERESESGHIYIYILSRSIRFDVRSLRTRRRQCFTGVDPDIPPRRTVRAVQTLRTRVRFLQFVGRRYALPANTVVEREFPRVELPLVHDTYVSCFPYARAPCVYGMPDVGLLVRLCVCTRGTRDSFDAITCSRRRMVTRARLQNRTCWSEGRSFGDAYVRTYVENEREKPNSFCAFVRSGNGKTFRRNVRSILVLSNKQHVVRLDFRVATFRSFRAPVLRVLAAGLVHQ